MVWVAPNRASGFQFAVDPVDCQNGMGLDEAGALHDIQTDPATANDADALSGGDLAGPHYGPDSGGHAASHESGGLDGVTLRQGQDGVGVDDGVFGHGAESGELANLEISLVKSAGPIGKMAAIA